MTFRRFDLVSTDAQTALTLYESAFMQSLMSEDMDPDSLWATLYGKVHATTMLRTRWPISLDAAGFKKLNGDPQYRDLSHATIELINEVWQDGVAELARIIEAPEFVGWGQAPENMAMARRLKPNELVAALLAVGETTSSWDGGNFFRTGHPFNPKKTGLGTYDNLVDTHAIGGASIAFFREYFRTMKNASGKNAGLRFTHIMCGPSQEEGWRDVLERDWILEDSGSKDASAAVTNRYKGAVQLIVGNQLEDVAGESNYYYPLALNKPGLEPWVVVEGQDEQISHDKSSAMYELHKKVGFSSEIELGAGLAMPQGIVRAKIIA